MEWNAVLVVLFVTFVRGITRKIKKGEIETEGSFYTLGS